LRTALASRKAVGDHNIDEQRDIGQISTWLALTLARQHRLPEAKATIGPVIALQRGLAARNHGDEWQHVELAAALYTDALASPNSRSGLLREAAALLSHLPAEMRATTTVRRWSGWIAEAKQGRA
jgi:hypothetical protein